LDSVISVSRSEWESFLAEFSELAQKYQLILNQLDLARTKVEGLREKSEQQLAKSSETLRQVRAALERLCDETEEELLEPE
jgi:ElaB/YqjD/DUF883 family membrane-anchored ribosome-binding protein